MLTLGFVVGMNVISCAIMISGFRGIFIYVHPMSVIVGHAVCSDLWSPRERVLRQGPCQWPAEVLSRNVDQCYQSRSSASYGWVWNTLPV